MINERARVISAMTTRINVEELPEFDAATYLGSEKEIAVFLTDILESNDSALLASAIGDVERARAKMMETQSKN
jgi:probable addiction module antidote protein